MNSYLDILPIGSTAVAVKTKGHNLDINLDGISSTGCWVVDKNRVDDYVIIFYETGAGNKIYIGDFLGKNPEEFTERQGKKYPRYRIFIGNISYKGETNHNWTRFVGKGNGGFERIYLENINKKNTVLLEPDSQQAIEGYKKDSKRMISSRDKKLSDKRKAKDNYTCQSCFNKIQVNNRYIIDCHHRDPVALGTRTTTINDLVSLCPTCHRIAHTRIPPYDELELREIVNTIKVVRAI